MTNSDQTRILTLEDGFLATLVTPMGRTHFFRASVVAALLRSNLRVRTVGTAEKQKGPVKGPFVFLARPTGLIPSPQGASVVPYVSVGAG